MGLIPQDETSKKRLKLLVETRLLMYAPTKEEKRQFLLFVMPLSFSNCYVYI